MVTSERPPRIVGDKAYDSDRARRELNRRGSELICPHRKNRRRSPLQDGRKVPGKGRNLPTGQPKLAMKNVLMLGTRNEALHKIIRAL